MTLLEREFIKRNFINRVTVRHKCSDNIWGCAPKVRKIDQNKLEILPASFGNIVTYAIMEAKAWSYIAILTTVHMSSK